MGKQIVRIGISVNVDTWKAVTDAESFRGVTPSGFYPEGGEPVIWLTYVTENNEVVKEFHEKVMSGLPLKWAGEQYDAVAAFHEYFRAAIEGAKAESRAEGAENAAGVGIGLQSSRADRERKRVEFEATLDRDAKRAAESELLEESLQSSKDPAEEELEDPPN